LADQTASGLGDDGSAADRDLLAQEADGLDDVLRNTVTTGHL